MEAEYMAATQKALWQARILQQLGEHIDTKTNFAREAQTNAFIKLVYVPTAEQLADGMTKALPFSLFQSICLDHYLHRYEFDTHW